MENNRVFTYVEEILKNMPKGWLDITTHRLDIYNEALAKTQFNEEFENLFQNNIATPEALAILPTAYDYIRLGHPLSCVLEWAVAKQNNLKAENVIAFDSKTMPLLAILRKNLLDGTHTQVLYSGERPLILDSDTLKNVYGYEFDVKKVEEFDGLSDTSDCVVFISDNADLGAMKFNSAIDFYIHLLPSLGSVLIANGASKDAYVSEIQHVRRRETVAITPSNALTSIKNMLGHSVETHNNTLVENKSSVLQSISDITGANTKALVASSGLSIQYAILMGLVHDAKEKHIDKGIRIVVPPNCYGGTNDQARRVAACVDNVEIVDLPVDGDHDMVQSIDKVLTDIAAENAIPYIIAEIPTNPRVEVPNLEELRKALRAERKTSNGNLAIDPVFILDQTFCPNVAFVGDADILAEVRTISFASGSKFPSGGKCTAGYCIANKKAEQLIAKVEQQLLLCDNEATPLQYEILAQQLPSMVQRVADAYKNTRAFVNYIEEVLPAAKINFVSEELAAQGFTPSVFSLDLPTKGATAEEREEYKRALNLKLIDLMITEIPTESKYCVSYGQLKGCYWTIPATSTQGTTKEGDKDYIARVAVSPDLDLDRHKKVFSDFVESMK